MSNLEPVAGGPRYVVYEFCISVVFLSFKRTSDIQRIEPGQSRLTRGLPFVLVSLLLGWWGIPWGPWWTVRAIYRDLQGGIDVTEHVLRAAAGPTATQVATVHARSAGATSEPPAATTDPSPTAPPADPALSSWEQPPSMTFPH